jgi:NitT/TauT family transport system substrate-binding protein
MSISIHLRQTAAAVVLCLVLFSCTEQPRKTPDVFKVGIATWPGFAPGYIAKEKGFFGDLPVEFYIIDDFTARQTAYVSNKTMATIGSIDSYAFDQGNGVDGKMVMILDRSNGADAIVVGPAIKNIAGLKGKKIAYTKGSPSHFFLVHLLKTVGLTPADIIPVEVDDPGKAGEAFVSGSVDAAVTWEPNISQIEASGKGKVLESSHSSPGLIVDQMTISPKTYADKKEEVQIFVDGWLKAVEYIKTHEADAYAIMARNMNIKAAEFPQMAAKISFADRQTNTDWLVSGGGAKARTLYEEAADIWQQQKMIKRIVPDSTIILGTFIRP